MNMKVQNLTTKFQYVIDMDVQLGFSPKGKDEYLKQDHEEGI